MMLAPECPVREKRVRENSMNPVVHFEILSAPGGAAALREFYAQTFGWSYNVVPEMDYGLIEAPDDRRGVGGAVAAVEEGPPRVIVYIEVEDPAVALQQAEANGAEITREVTVIPGMVTFGEFRDPAGNIVGVVASETPPAE